MAAQRQILRHIKFPSKSWKSQISGPEIKGGGLLGRGGFTGYRYPDPHKNRVWSINSASNSTMRVRQRTQTRCSNHASKQQTCGQRGKQEMVVQKPLGEFCRSLPGRTKTRSGSDNVCLMNIVSPFQKSFWTRYFQIWFDFWSGHDGMSYHIVQERSLCAQRLVWEHRIVLNSLLFASGLSILTSCTSFNSELKVDFRFKVKCNGLLIKFHALSQSKCSIAVGQNDRSVLADVPGCRE